MSQASSPSLKPRKPARILLFLAGVPPAVGLIGELLLDFRTDAAGDFYSTCAQVISTLFVLLAGLLTFLAIVMDHDDPKTETWVLAVVTGVLVQTLFGLGVSLYAAGSGCSSVFLALSAAATIATQVVAGVGLAFGSAFPKFFTDPDETEEPPPPGDGGTD